MKNLELKKTETKNKSGKFLYEVIENGVVIANRRSNKDYVACFVTKQTSGEDYCTKEKFTEENPSYYLPYFFGRPDLIGKGDSGKRDISTYYALAKLI